MEQEQEQKQVQTVRCRFRCQSVTKRVDGNGEHPFVFDAQFGPVYHGSEENRRFWQATPGGQLQISSYKADSFVPGKYYYLDMTEAPE